MNKTQSPVSIRRLALAGFTTVLLLAAPGVAQAQTVTPPSVQATPAPRKAAGVVRDRALMRAYHAEQKSLARQTRVFNKLDALIARAGNAPVGKLSDAQKSAVAQAQAKLAEAKAVHAAAADTLRTHAGFDGNGAITDVTAAQATVGTARKQLADARQAFMAAARLLKDARK